MRSFGLAVAFLLLATFIPASDGQAPAADFVVLASEVDNPPHPVGAYDILELAVGEPGDGTVVFRFTLKSSPDGVNGEVYAGFTTAAGDIVGGCGYSGTPDTRNIGEPIAPDSCIMDGAVIYAIYSYGTAQVAIGDTITKTWAFTDICGQEDNACLPADTLPGGIANQGWPATTYGADYPVTGCSNAAGCGGGSATSTTSSTSNSTTNSTTSTVSVSSSSTSTSASRTSTSASSSSSAESTSHASSSTNATSAEKKSSPGLPMLATLAVVGVAFAIIRRRLD